MVTQATRGLSDEKIYPIINLSLLLAVSVAALITNKETSRSFARTKTAVLASILKRIRSNSG